MTPTEIRAALEACRRATPGPWHLTKDRQSIIQTSHITRDVWTIPRSKGDMDFIPLARTALPAALKMIGELLDVLDVALDYTAHGSNENGRPCKTVETLVPGDCDCGSNRCDERIAQFTTPEFREVAAEIGREKG